jgi:hypothetical protein
MWEGGDRIAAGISLRPVPQGPAREAARGLDWFPTLGLASPVSRGLWLDVLGVLRYAMGGGWDVASLTAVTGPRRLRADLGGDIEALVTVARGRPGPRHRRPDRAGGHFSLAGGRRHPVPVVGSRRGRGCRTAQRGIL